MDSRNAGPIPRAAWWPARRAPLPSQSESDGKGMTTRRWLQWRGVSPSRNLEADARCELTELTEPGLCQFSQFAISHSPRISGESSCANSDRSELGVNGVAKVALALNQEDPPSASYADWKVTSLHRLFQAQGLTRQPGRITAATVLHGERRERQVPAKNPESSRRCTCPSG